MNSLPYFEDLDLGFSGRVVFLDVDGTLVFDADLHFNPQVLKQLEKLAIRNQVFLCTNSNNRARSAKIESLLNLPIVTHNYKKPSSKVLRGLGIGSGEEMIVIGDKYLTDGLFARNIGAEFVRVRRRISGNEAFIVRFINFLDDIIWETAKFLRFI